MKKEMEFLSLSELFKDIAESDLEEIYGYMQHKKYMTDSEIFGEDDIGDNLHVLTQGSVKITIRAVWRMQEEEIVHVVRPGEIFGEFSFIDGCRRSASAVASEDSTVLVLSRSDFDDFSLRKPLVALQIMHNFAWILTNKLRNTTLLWRSSMT